MKTLIIIACLLASLFGKVNANNSRSGMILVDPKIDRIKGTDSEILIYSFLPKSKEKVPTIVMLAGGDGSKMIGKISPIHYEFANQMNGYGYAVFAIDYRNPNRIFLDKKWIDDIEIGMKRIKSNEVVDSNSVFIAGFSMGGTNAIRYLTRDKNISELILYGSPMKFTKPQLLKIIEAEEMPIHLSKLINTPILFFQGMDDSITTKEQSDEFIDSLKFYKKTVNYIIYENTRHGFTYSGVKGDKVQYSQVSAYDSYRKVIDFIKMWLDLSLEVQP